MSMHLHHLALYVRDLEAAKDFFCRYFDARPSAQYHNPKTTFRSYFLHFEKGADLELMTRSDLDLSAGQRPEKSCGYAHLCFALGSREAVDAKTAELKAAGFTLLNGPRVTGDGYYESVFSGIEGNLIELTV